MDAKQAEHAATRRKKYLTLPERSAYHRMKHLHPLAVAAALAVILLTPAPSRSNPQNTMWKEINTAIDKGQPKTAIELIDAHLAEASRSTEPDHADLLKAHLLKLRLETQIEGFQPEEGVRRLEALLPAAPAKLQPLIRLAIARSYWHYLVENEWRIIGRTRTADQAGDPSHMPKPNSMPSLKNTARAHPS